MLIKIDMFGHFLVVKFGGGWVLNWRLTKKNNDFIHAFYFTTKNCVVGKKAVIWENGNEDLSSIALFSGLQLTLGLMLYLML